MGRVVFQEKKKIIIEIETMVSANFILYSYV